MLNRINKEGIQIKVHSTKKNPISNLISGNFSKIKQQIEEVKKEVLDLRKSIQFTENQVEKKVSNAENKLVDIKQRIEKIYDYQIDPDYVLQKLIDLEK